MLKITEKVIRYNIENLTVEDYEYLKHLFLVSKIYHGGLPNIKFALKILSIEDVKFMYQVNDEFLERNNLTN